MATTAPSALSAEAQQARPAAASHPHDGATARAKIMADIQPYVDSGNFSGSILVVRNGKTLLRNSYGLSDISRQTPNRPDTKFHIASLSTQFTAATAMRLVEQGKLSPGHEGQ